MDAVNAFNQELFSLMDSKPPISRAKMISITKSAIKAMKLYKHVVQIVEKFIKKCKPEYKVAGLYVVDSIVRQSRHQFGADKDVFGPRFTKNITGTFENLCLCPIEDRSKIVRVLNLWQKNGVFKIEIIQPLLDMAAGSGSGAVAFESATEPGSSPPPAKEPVPVVTDNSSTTSVPQLHNSDAFAAVAQLFQTSQGQQLQQMLQNFQQPPLKPEANTQPLAQNVPPPLQNVSSGLNAVASQPPVPAPPPRQPTLSTQPAQQKTAFDKKLLDRFDYDDEPEAGEETKKEESSSHLPFMQQPSAFPQHAEHFNAHVMNMSQDFSQQPSGIPSGQNLPFTMGHPGQPFPGSSAGPAITGMYPPQSAAQQKQFQDLSMEAEHAPMRDGRHGRRSRSGSRSPKRRRSRSNSRSRRSRHRRSRSRDRRHHSPRSRSQERRERERERERRQKGLPPPKNEAVSICSTTLWVGQLDKRTQQQDVASLLEEFGQIESINMIPPRGCAYIVMIHRQDAFRALQKLSRGPYKVNQKTIKIAWALNKGIKPEFKQYWDVELGVTCIPWSKVREEQLEELKEGGMLDSDTLSPEWVGLRKSLGQSEELTHNGGSEQQQNEDMLAIPVSSAASAPPVQVPPMQQPGVGMGSLQPPVFPGPIGMPPPSFTPGVPPPPFIRPGFNPMQMPPGFPPPGPMGLGPPPTSKGRVDDPHLDPAGQGNKSNEDVLESPNMFNNHMAAMGNQIGGPPGAPISNRPPAHLVGHPGGLPVGPPGGPPVVGPPGGPPLGPPIGPPGGPPVVPPGALSGGHQGNLQSLSSGLLGARPGIIPLQRPSVPPPTQMQRFPPPHGARPPHANMPPIPPQMMARGPHPQMMLHDPPKGNFGIPPPHNMRPPFPHGPPPPSQGPPSQAPHSPFIRPGGPRGLEGPDEMEERPFRGERPGFRDREQERERDWDRNRDRERDRSFGGGRRLFADGGRGGANDKMDGRERLGGWPEEGSNRGGGWDRDRDRDRDRRDWREKRGSLDRDRERGRADEGERDRGRDEGGDRVRGEAASRDRSRGDDGKGDKPRRSERRERATRWDKDDRLAEMENIDRFRTPDSKDQTIVNPVETTKAPEVVPFQKKEESEHLAPHTESTSAAETPAHSGPPPPARTEPTETNKEAGV